MRVIKLLLFGVIIVGMISCTKPTARNTNVISNDPVLKTYENDLFSVDLPKGWVCDSSGWNGLDSLQNSVEIFDPYGSVVWLRFVKSFISAQWKNMDEVKEWAKFGKTTSGDDAELIHEIDSIEVGGYPTSILYFANYVDNDTIIQKQFVTYLQDSHIVVYFNENFYIEDWDRAEKLGDLIIGTVKLKKVVNPLEMKADSRNQRKKD